MIALQNHPYLVVSLVLTALFLAGLVSFPKKRRLMIISGLLAVPFCLYEFVFIPEYWSPAMVGGWKLGPEDMLFSFSTGGIAWIFATLGLRNDFTINWQSRRFIRRFFFFSLLGVGMTLILWGTGLRIMTAVLLCIAAGLGFLLWRSPHLPLLSGFAGGAGFAVVYSLILAGMFALSPGFSSHWNSVNLSGVTVIGIPAEESLWALCFGAIWPRFMAYVLDVRPMEKLNSLRLYTGK
ncbi:MAG: lycopene cyclase domain-containing protein [Candidatus Aminicenantaceae bacterium]